MVKNKTTTTKLARSQDEATITIAMSERRPVIIYVKEWPILAEAHRENASEGNHIFLYKNKDDGRCIVRGEKWFLLKEGVGEQYTKAGFLVNGKKGKELNPDYDEIIHSIRRVAGIIGGSGNLNFGLADEVISQLPGEYI